MDNLEDLSWKEVCLAAGLCACGSQVIKNNNNSRKTDAFHLMFVLSYTFPKRECEDSLLKYNNSNNICLVIFAMMYSFILNMLYTVRRN